MTPTTQPFSIETRKKWYSISAKILKLAFWVLGAFMLVLIGLEGPNVKSSLWPGLLLFSCFSGLAFLVMWKKTIEILINDDELPNPQYPGKTYDRTYFFLACAMWIWAVAAFLSYLSSSEFWGLHDFFKQYPEWDYFLTSTLSSLNTMCFLLAIRDFNLQQEPKWFGQRPIRWMRKLKGILILTITALAISGGLVFGFNVGNWAFLPDTILSVLTLFMLLVSLKTMFEERGFGRLRVLVDVAILFALVVSLAQLLPQNLNIKETELYYSLYLVYKLAFISIHLILGLSWVSSLMVGYIGSFEEKLSSKEKQLNEWQAKLEEMGIELKKKDEELKETDKRLKNIFHDVANNITSLHENCNRILESQKKGQKIDDELNNLKIRIDNLSNLYRLLHNKEERFLHYSQKIFDSIQKYNPEFLMTLNCDQGQCEEFKMDPNKSYDIWIILVELLTNARRHAFSQGFEGDKKIVITLEESCLTFYCNGDQSFPEKFGGVIEWVNDENRNKDFEPNIGGGWNNIRSSCQKHAMRIEKGEKQLIKFFLDKKPS